MNKTFHPNCQLFVFAILIATASAGCGNRGASTADAQKTQPDSSSKTVSPSELVSAPDTSVMDAAVKGNVDVIRQHVAAGTDLNQRNSNGATALIAAASLGQKKTAIMLIEGGADLEVKGNNGSTALHTAAFLCREEIVKALLAKGADKEARNNAGSTAFDSVAGPFDEVKPIYDFLQKALDPLGVELDYDRIMATRPKMAEMLRAD
ncbi:ankyrin repeat domain-containing protein [bacterium]|nr:ankyrin repeat domain-containing protein [bacterium]